MHVHVKRKLTAFRSKQKFCGLSVSVHYFLCPHKNLNLPCKSFAGHSPSVNQPLYFSFSQRIQVQCMFWTSALGVTCSLFFLFFSKFSLLWVCLFFWLVFVVVFFGGVVFINLLCKHPYCDFITYLIQGLSQATIINLYFHWCD